MFLIPEKSKLQKEDCSSDVFTLSEKMLCEECGEIPVATMEALDFIKLHKESSLFPFLLHCLFPNVNFQLLALTILRNLFFHQQ